MLIKELVKQLQAYDGNNEVYLSNDPEGNEFRTIEEVAKMGDKEGVVVVIWPTDDLVEICECGFISDADGRCGCTNKDAN